MFRISAPVYMYSRLSLLHIFLSNILFFLATPSDTKNFFFWESKRSNRIYVMYLISIENIEYKLISKA